MFCLTCGYDLSKSARGPCPECGREFDPADAGSWRPCARTNVRWFALGALLFCPGRLWPALGIGFAYALAWAVLGHRPRPSQDDPKTLSAANDVMHWLVIIGMLMSLPMTLASISLSVWVTSIDRSWRKPRFIIVGARIAWPIAMVVLWLYPPFMVTWWLD